MKRRIIVIGLGTLGKEVALFLANNGAEVLAIDKQEEEVTRIAKEVSQVAIVDGTDMKTLRSLNAQEYDGAVVAIGDNIQSSIMTTLVLKDHLRIPEVFARAVNEDHGQILDKVGADTVFHVEREMGRRVGSSILRPHFRDYFGVSGDLAVIEINAEESMIGKTMAELDFKNRYKAYCLALRRGRAGEKEELGGLKTQETGRDRVVNMPEADTRIQADDVLVLIGMDRDLQSL
ncbi:MAG: TrkA family potassium uptake protein [Planctomycetota bacterium]|jgi:trk system potassium uptake protein TrkA|nr:TrkA family potassium uptake protein [Planctomycetota bacterium]